ncbi:hypothetical protein ACR79T_09755 [Sphingobacterium spiritivorum]|uniref:hypothetical protein n=1 Tax=Sphingobacterium spiritivorum TaxID=258 RepID=UPI003DA1F584
MQKILLWIPLFLSILACNNQPEETNNQKDITMPEKFDVELYKKYQKGTDLLVLANGNTILSMTAPENTETGAQQELLPKPSFLVCYKEFYPNGNLKLKELLLSETVKVGKSEYYNQEGQPERTVNEDEKFGKVKYQQVLNFLDSKGYINTKDGSGRLNEDGTPKYDIQYQAKDKQWIIILYQGRKLSEQEFLEVSRQNGGEPNPWKPVYYVMNADTGATKEVLQLPE